MGISFSCSHEVCGFGADYLSKMAVKVAQRLIQGIIGKLFKILPVVVPLLSLSSRGDRKSKITTMIMMMYVSFNCNTTGVTCGSVTANPSGKPEFTPGF